MVLQRRRRVRPVNPDAVSPWPFVGMVLLLCDLFLFGASILLVPWYVTVLMVLAWVPLFGAGVTWFEPHPRRLVPAALIAAVAWFAIIVGGSLAFGWS